MNYIELTIPTADETMQEILTAELSDFPFESFDNGELGLKAYIPEDALPPCREEVDHLLRGYGFEGSYLKIEERNWNEEWEKDFPMTDIEGRLIIRAPFHEAAPEGVTEVIVRPRQAFGSGQHATTWMMSRELLDMALDGKSGLDMGSGTGVLSLVAVKCGARHMDAVDIDPWSDDNCRENIATNHMEGRITPLLGSTERIADRHYDFVVANIHRNIHLAAMEVYARVLNPGGDLLLSGFFEEDIAPLEESAARYGLRTQSVRSRDEWRLLHLVKNGTEEL